MTQAHTHTTHAHAHTLAQTFNGARRCRSLPARACSFHLNLLGATWQSTWAWTERRRIAEQVTTKLERSSKILGISGVAAPALACGGRDCERGAKYEERNSGLFGLWVLDERKLETITIISANLRRGNSDAVTSHFIPFDDAARTHTHTHTAAAQAAQRSA